MSVTVTVNGDDLAETDEIFHVVLSSTEGAFLADKSVGVGTILDDDTVLPASAATSITDTLGTPQVEPVSADPTLPVADSVSVPSESTNTDPQIGWLPGESSDALFSQMLLIDNAPVGFGWVFDMGSLSDSSFGAPEGTNARAAQNGDLDGTELSFRYMTTKQASTSQLPAPEEESREESLLDEELIELLARDLLETA
jgi:hypothetical protein